MADGKAVRPIKVDGKTIAIGDEVNKEDFSTESWKAMVSAGTIERSKSKARKTSE